MRQSPAARRSVAATLALIALATGFGLDARAATASASLSGIRLEVFALDGSSPPVAFTHSASAVSAAAGAGGDNIIAGFASGFTVSSAVTSTSFTSAAVLPGTLLSQGGAVDGGSWSDTRAIAQDLFGVLAPHTGLMVSGLATLQWTANDQCGLATCESVSIIGGFDSSLVVNDVRLDQFGSPQVQSSFFGAQQGNGSFNSFLYSDVLSFTFTNATNFFAQVAVIAFVSTSGSGGVVPMTPVPEPQTYALLALGLLALTVRARRRHRG